MAKYKIEKEWRPEPKLFKYYGYKWVEPVGWTLLDPSGFSSQSECKESIVNRNIPNEVVEEFEI